MSWVVCLEQIVSSNPVNEKEEGVVALHITTGPLKTRSGLKLVPRCELSTFQLRHRGRLHQDDEFDC